MSYQQSFCPHLPVQSPAVEPPSRRRYRRRLLFLAPWFVPAISLGIVRLVWFHELPPGVSVTFGLVAAVMPLAGLVLLDRAERREKEPPKNP